MMFPIRRKHRPRRGAGTYLFLMTEPKAKGQEAPGSLTKAHTQDPDENISLLKPMST